MLTHHDQKRRRTWPLQLLLQPLQRLSLLCRCQGEVGTLGRTPVRGSHIAVEHDAVH